MTDMVVALTTRATGLVAAVEAVTVTTHESFEMAGVLAQDLARFVKAVNDFCDPVVSAAFAAHKAATAQRTKLLGSADTARRALGQKMAAYEQEQASIRREAEEAQRQEREKLEQEARAQAATEQRRLQKEAEDARLEAAAALERTGDVQAAHRLIEAPIVLAVVTAAPVVVFTPPPPAAPKAEGISFRTDHGFEVTNDYLIPRIYMTVNESAIGKVYRALGPKTDIPGTKYVEKRVPITRTA